MSNMVSKRITWIDASKGFGALLIILAHISRSEAVNAWPLTVGVPLFFFLSGCTFSLKSNFNTFFVNKLKKLLIPYFSFGLIIFLFLNILGIIQGSFISVAYSVSYFWSRFLIQQRFTSLWFIPCLFCLETIFYFLIKHLKTLYIILVTALLFAIGFIYIKHGNPALPWNIDVSLTASPFFLVGYCCKKFKDKLSPFLQSNIQKLIICFSFLLISAVSTIINWKCTGTFFNLFPNRYCIAPLSYIAAFTGIFSVCIFFSLLPLRFFQYIGKNCIVYYACHSEIMIPIAQTILHRLNILRVHSSLFEIILYDFLVISIILLLCTIASIVINHSKLKFMVGK